MDTYKTNLPPSLVKSTCRYPINAHVPNKHLVASSKFVLASVFALIEPDTYVEAVKHEALKKVMSE